MWSFLCLFAVLCVLIAQSGQVEGRRFLKYSTPAVPKYGYETKYFRQKIDHFSFADVGYYQMRYLVNDTLWRKDNGPIFFYTGNEGDITAFCDNTGFMWDIAPTFGAKLVFAEHRYYGKSLPFGNDSYKQPNLRYFTSEQAMADYAVLLKSLNPGGNPVVVFGGSYGGMLSAWMRMKYPHLVTGAVASSAPIWQFTGLTRCGVFNQIVTIDFIKVNHLCMWNVKKLWEAINVINETDKGRRQLGESLRLCKPLKASDVSAVKQWITDILGNIAMVNYPYPTEFLQPLPAWPMKEFCKHLAEPFMGPQLIKRFGDALNVYFNYTGQTKCFDIHSESSGAISDLGWDYQACTEMVMPMCSHTTDDMFEPQEWNFTEYSLGCKKRWGVTPDPDWVITHFTDRHINASSNIVFPNGQLDPWSGGGVLTTVNPSLPAIHIPLAAHHLDLRASNPADSIQLLLARRQIIMNILSWVNGTKTEDPLRFTPGGRL